MFQITRPDVNFGVPQKNKVATSTIPDGRYGEILFQKVALCYLLHVVQDGCSKSAIQTYIFCIYIYIYVFNMFLFFVYISSLTPDQPPPPFKGGYLYVLLLLLCYFNKNWSLASIGICRPYMAPLTSIGWGRAAMSKTTWPAKLLASRMSPSWRSSHAAGGKANSHLRYFFF